MKAKRPFLLHLLVWLAVAGVVIPVFILVVWCFVNRWPWPQILPQSFTGRGLQRLFSGYLDIGRVLFSSILLAAIAGVVATVIAAMAARAIALYSFAGKKLVEEIAFLPVVVPAAAFAMGSHMLFLRLGAGNTPAAVIIGYLIYGLPFAVKIMVDTTKMCSRRWEEQAQVLGAGPFKAFAAGSLPFIAPGMVSSMAVVFLLSYTQYFLTLVLGGGRVKTMAILVMPLITGSDRTISSIFSLLYILSAFLVFVLFQWVTKILAKRLGAQLGV